MASTVTAMDDMLPRRKRRLRRLGCAGGLLVVAALTTALVWDEAWSHVRAAGMLARLDRGVAQPQDVASWGHVPIAREEIRLDAGGEATQATLYRPKVRPDAPGLLLAHGVHPMGRKEPHLVRLAEAIASGGVAVLVPDIPALLEHEVRPEAIGQLSAMATAFAGRLKRKSVGVMGISFAGGLGLIAAARQQAPRTIGSVTAIGGHYSVRRLVDFYVGTSSRGPGGETFDVEPHVYGAGVIIHTYADAFFEKADREPAKRALAKLLEGRHSEARKMTDGLSDEGREQMLRILNRNDDQALSKSIYEALEAHSAEVDAVSPKGNLSEVDVPIFLVHGRGDPVIPATETLWLAKHVPDERLEEVVITRLLTHTDLEKSSLHEKWELVHFLAEVLQVLE